ncbi:MAG: hypothetical protein ACXVZH_16955 [Terriglobales bacterium]
MSPFDDVGGGAVAPTRAFPLGSLFEHLLIEFVHVHLIAVKA